MLEKLKNEAFFKNSFIVFFGGIIGSFLNYIFHLIIGRMVSIPVYGEIESLTSLLSIISIPIATLGMIITQSNAFDKANNDKEKSRRDFFNITKKLLYCSLFVFLVLLLLTPLVGKFLNIDNPIAIILVWIIIAVSLLSSVSGGILTGWQKFKEISIIGIISTFAKLAGGVILVKIGLALTGSIGGFVIGSVVSYALSLLALKFVFKTKDKGKKEILEKKESVSFKKYIIPFFWGNMSMAILGSADMIIAKHNLSDISAGEYGALSIVSKIIFFATGAITSVLFSMSSCENYGKKIPTNIFKKALYLMFFVSGLAIIFYFIFSEFTLGMLFGSKYSQVAHYLGWFAILASLFSINNLIFQYLLSIRRKMISYYLLGSSLLAVFFMLVYGKNITEILFIMSVAQIVSIISGCFLLKSKKNNNGK